MPIRGEEDEKRRRLESDEIQQRKKGGASSSKRRRRSKAEEEEDSEDGGGRKRIRSVFVDDEAVEDEDEEEEDENEFEEDGFVVNEIEDEPEQVDSDGGGSGRRRMGLVLPHEEEEEVEDIEKLEKQIEERYGFGGVRDTYYDDDLDDAVGQQSLIPGVKDPKLWLVKCVNGREKEVAVCLMQKFIDKPGELQIMSAFAVDGPSGFVYVEAFREAHVREACKGLRYVMPQKIVVVPIKEMTTVLSGGCENSKNVVEKDSWVRIRRSKEYQGDLAKVVDVNYGRKRVRVRLCPRIDLQALVEKMKGFEIGKKKKGIAPCVRPERLVNLATDLGWQVKEQPDPRTGDYIQRIDGLSGVFQNGFLLKWFHMQSIITEGITPSLEELQSFEEFEGVDEDHIKPIRKKCENFLKGDAVVVMKGDMRNMVGHVHKVEEEIVHIRPEIEGLSEIVAIDKRELQKCFKDGCHVKVVKGSQKGATGIVVKVDHQNQLITILSDGTREAICVFFDDAVESSEVNNGDRKGDFLCSRFDHHRTPRNQQFSGGRRGHDNGFGKGSRVKLRVGPYKGCRGRVVEVKGSNVRVELESQMKTVLVDRNCIMDSDNVVAAVTTPYRSGCETPMPYMKTPMRDPGMMTPMRDPATPRPYMMTPMRDPSSTPRPYVMTPTRDPRATPSHDGWRTPIY